MDDSCAVCADSLEWVAYGPCGHREVCSTCVVRLRFICDDRRCCICKAESDFVFVTKAMGDYTKMIGDFSKLSSHAKEGKVGAYWYHEDTQAFFDDAEHYKMIKATCRLSCSVCDQDDPNKHPRFRNISQLKGHLAHQHKLFMCDLCLEGRKVFICEQKLYSRSQLLQHNRTGDSLVDGSESGFSGHPLCHYCRTSFYGENEFFTHMSREHFTCHLCQRQHPERHHYFKDYDELETHYRHDHHLCEDEECLSKKFIVFLTAEDLKRHNALEHGGRMSRSKRNAVLQIPTSFIYRSNNESGYHRGRRRSVRRELSPDRELGLVVQDTLERDSSIVMLPDRSASAASTEPSLAEPFESLGINESESSSRYRQAVSQILTTGSLVESSFPPLASAPSSSQQNPRPKSKNTMAARLRRQNKASVLNVAQPRTASSGLWSAPVIPSQRPAAPMPTPRPAVPTPAPRPAATTPVPPPAAITLATQPPQASPAPGPAPGTSSPWPSLVPSSGSSQMKAATVNGSESSSYARSLRSVDEPGLSVGGSWVSKNTGGSSRLNHSTSAPNLVDSRSFDPVADFPPVSATQRNRQSSDKNKTEGVQTANKTLVERMRAALDFDEDKYNVFKGISQEYRQGSIDTWEYLEYVKQFDLTHLVPDLARLLPDIRKQKELLEAYSASTQSNGSRETFWDDGNIHMKGSSSSKDKGKKVVNSEKTSRPQESLADSVISTVRSLQSQFKPSEEVEVLEKDGYRTSRGKSTVAVGGNGLPPPSESGGNKNGRSSVDGSKAKNQKKKTSKFHRLRLGDNSPAATLDVRNSTSNDTPAEMGGASASGWLNSSEGVSSRSVWSGKGGQRLFTK
ncbi:hypothetical protein RND81_02G001000 [Saponaria officinalis]|uniref:RING-type E3 ubiquitin transferase n=1 Tax=Saponaria officinalis TaxID=3572 RepID=A0AAW1MNK7_SAPOF